MSGEAEKVLTSVENEDIVASLDQVCCYEIPPKSPGARNCKWLCGRVGAEKQFPKHGESLSEDIYKRSTNMAFAADTLHVRQSDEHKNE